MTEPALQRIVVERSAYYAVHVPESSAPPPLLVALHGYGQTCTEFLEELAPLREAGFLVVAPQAPNAFYSPPEGKLGFAWITRFEKAQAIEDLLIFLRAVLDDITQKYTYDTDRIVLLGFSQGAVLAFRSAAAGVSPLRGVVSCGADLPADVVDQLETITPLPTLVVHGKRDKLMPLEKAEHAAATLEASGFPVTRHFHNGGHSLRASELNAIFEWMRELW